jgi:hypothetical protein
MGARFDDDCRLSPRRSLRFIASEPGLTAVQSSVDATCAPRL